MLKETALRFCGQRGLDPLFSDALARIREILLPALGTLAVDQRFYEDYTVYITDRDDPALDPVVILLGDERPVSHPVREDLLKYSRARERTEHPQTPQRDRLLVIVFHGPSLSGSSGHIWGDLPLASPPSRPAREAPTLHETHLGLKSVDERRHRRQLPSIKSPRKRSTDDVGQAA